MTTFLALKYAKPEGLGKGLFHDLTKARLVTRYPHAGIVKDGMLMHANLSRGLHKEPFVQGGWVLSPIPDKPWQPGLFEQWEGTEYDVFSLLAFVTPFAVRDSSRMYCYEWCWLWLTGQKPIERVTPEDLAIEALRQGKPA